MELIDQFIKGVSAGLDAWFTAGKLLIEIKARSPDGFSKIMERAPWITPDLLHSFLAIGQRKLYPPALMISNSRIGNRILEMPYEAQEKACNHDIEVVTLTLNGKNIRKKPINQITADEAGVIFGSDGLRSVPEQIRILSEKRKVRKNPVHNEGNAEWKALGKKSADLVGFTVAANGNGPTSKPVGLYSVRKVIGGQIAFEKTTARPMTTQRVLLSDGIAVIEICDWGKQT